MFYSSTSFPPALERIVQGFQQTSDPKEKYEDLLWLAKRLPEVPAAAKIATNKVPGCVSQVSITGALEDGKVAFYSDSDAQITKGLVALLIEGLSGLFPLEIQDPGASSQQLDSTTIFSSCSTKLQLTNLKICPP